MFVTNRRQNDAIILELSGRFDFRSRKIFQEALEKAKDFRIIVVDLGRVSFVDSAALGLLSIWHSRLQGEGISLRLAGAEGYVHTVFELFRIAQLIPTFSTIEEAVQMQAIHRSSPSPMSTGSMHDE